MAIDEKCPHHCNFSPLCILTFVYYSHSCTIQKDVPAYKKGITAIIMKNVSLLSARFQFSISKPDMVDLVLAENCSRCGKTFGEGFFIWKRKKINCPGCGQVNIIAAK